MVGERFCMEEGCEALLGFRVIQEPEIVQFLFEDSAASHFPNRQPLSDISKNRSQICGRWIFILYQERP